MTWLRALSQSVGRVFARRTHDLDFDEEVRNHLAMLTERFVRQGMTPEGAAAAARRQFGNVRIVKDDRRDLMGGVALEAWISDLRLAVRGLRRSSGFAVTAILLLALGIGANTAIFSVLDEVLIRPLPVQRPRELALVRLAISPRATFQGAARLGFVSVREFLGPNAGIPFPVFDALRRTNQVFSGVLAEGPRTTVELQAARETGDAGLAHAAFVSGNYFSVLGLAPAAGRLFVDADDDRARGPGVVISHRYWERHFGRDPNVAGAAVFLNDISATVLGVAPAAFDGSAPGNPTDVWIPLAFRPGVAPAAPPDLTLIGRLRPGTTRAAAQTSIRALVPSLHIGDVFEIQDNKPDWFDLIVTDGSTGTSSLREKHAVALTIGMGAAIVDLLIACANLAGLVLARARTRQREVALLLSLGAGRWRVVRQIFLQNLLLAVSGGIVGWWLAQWGSLVLVGLVSGSSDALPGVQADWRLLGFTTATTLAAVLLFGLAPAIRAARLDPKLVLSEGTPSTPTTTVGRAPWRLLVPAQIAASIVLLVCALLFGRTLATLGAIDLGFRADRLVMVQFETGVERGAALASRAAELDRRLQSMPGVTSTAIVTAPPFGGPAGASRILVAGYTPAPNDAYFTANSLVGTGFFRTSGIRIVRGRDFAETDALGDPSGMAAQSKVAIVNEAFVRKFFSAGDPIGRKFTMSRVDYVIVGVAQDARYQNLRSPVAPLAYLLVEQDPSRLRRLALIIRFSGPSSTIGTLTSAIHTAAREAGGLRIARVATLRELVDASVADERLAAAVSAGAGGLAVVLVAAGLFGTVAYTVTCRTRELGIRAALGGGRWAILRMLMHETLVFVLAGIGLGLPLALATARLLSSKFFGVGLLDPVSFVASVGLMTTVTMAAGVVPAYRAAGAHPMIALRHE